MKTYALLALTIVSFNLNSMENSVSAELERQISDLEVRQNLQEKTIKELEQLLQNIPKFPSNHCIAAMIGGAFVSTVCLATITHKALEKYKVSTETPLALAAIYGSSLIGIIGGMCIARGICTYYKI